MNIECWCWCFIIPTTAFVTLCFTMLWIVWRSTMTGGILQSFQVKCVSYFHAGSKPAYISLWVLLLPIRSPLPMSLQITCLEHTLSCCLCLGIGHFWCILVLVQVSWWICKTRTLLEMQRYAQPYLSILSTFKCVSYVKWCDLWSCLQTSHDGSSLSSWSVLCSATWYILRDLFFTFSYRYIVCQHI